MTNPPTDLERITQAVSILKAVIRAEESNETTYHGDYDPTPALRAAVALIEDAEAGDRLPDAISMKLLEPGGILKACIVTHTTAHGMDWDMTWPLLPAVRLIDEVIADMRPRPDRRPRRRPRSAGEVVRLFGGTADS